MKCDVSQLNLRGCTMHSSLRDVLEETSMSIWPHNDLRWSTNEQVRVLSFPKVWYQIADPGRMEGLVSRGYKSEPRTWSCCTRHPTPLPTALYALKNNILKYIIYKNAKLLFQKRPTGVTKRSTCLRGDPKSHLFN